MMSDYIYIKCRIVGNPQDGFRTTYENDYKRFKSLSAAQKHGYILEESDDYLIGVVDNGRLTTVLASSGAPLDWPEEDYEEVRQQIDLS